MTMYEMFHSYYRPTDQEFEDLWKQCIFTFDTNVLLNVYRYTIETRQALIGVLKELQDRIWIPHQVAYEYQERRLDVIFDLLSTYEKLEGQLTNTLNLIKDLRDRHPCSDRIAQALSPCIEAACEELQKIKLEHPDLFESDTLREAIDDLFDGKVGSPYSPERLEEIYEEGRGRYEKQIPPGYGDMDKPEPRRYGDLVLWFQILDYAQSKEKPIILVTDEIKLDWWLRPHGRTIGPKRELVQEAYSKAGAKFHMYSASNFVKRAQEFLGAQEEKAAIEEMERARQKQAIFRGTRAFPRVQEETVATIEEMERVRREHFERAREYLEAQEELRLDLGLPKGVTGVLTAGYMVELAVYRWLQMRFPDKEVEGPRESFPDFVLTNPDSSRIMVEVTHAYDLPRPTNRLAAIQRRCQLYMRGTKYALFIHCAIIIVAANEEMALELAMWFEQSVKADPDFSFVFGFFTLEAEFQECITYGRLDEGYGRRGGWLLRQS